MLALKNRLKAIETALLPPQREKRIIVFSVVDYDDETDLIGYKCHGLTAKRNEGETLDDFSERAKTFFIANDKLNSFVLFLQSIYDRD